MGEKWGWGCSRPEFATDLTARLSIVWLVMGESQCSSDPNSEPEKPRPARLVLVSLVTFAKLAVD